jgi:hypothetical protein
LISVLDARNASPDACLWHAYKRAQARRVPGPELSIWATGVLARSSPDACLWHAYKRAQARRVPGPELSIWATGVLARSPYRGALSRPNFRRIRQASCGTLRLGEIRAISRKTMGRGGPRRRCIERGQAGVWCSGGRWGPRRTRTNECWATLRAEDVYTAVLQANESATKAGAQGTVIWTVEGGRDVHANWEIRANAVWRRGRMFLDCRHCGKRCTRLYLPLEDSSPRCRRCWGLTYASRTLQNYKDSLWGGRQFAWMFGTTQRDWAFSTTDERRAQRRSTSRDRWVQRRPYLSRCR